MIDDDEDDEPEQYLDPALQRIVQKVQAQKYKGGVASYPAMTHFDLFLDD